MTAGQRILACFTALMIGILIPGIATLPSAIQYGLGKFLQQEGTIFALQALMVAGPLIVLALMGSTSRKAWLFGTLTPAALWAWLILDAQLGQNGGANIGLGILMMFSPIIVAAICIAIAMLDEKRT